MVPETRLQEKLYTDFVIGLKWLRRISHPWTGMPVTWPKNGSDLSNTTNQAVHWLQNSCSCFQIHSPPDTSIHIRHASRIVQYQTATLQFIVVISFYWTSHPIFNLCWQILFLLWSENLESNQLPEDIKCAGSIDIFKRLLRHHLELV